MRVYLIKRKGKNQWYNINFDRELVFSDNEKIHAGLFFIRKKDANKYLQTFSYKELFEVVGATLDNSLKTIK